MDKKQFLSTEKRAQIVLLNNLKFSIRQIARKMKVSKTAVHHAIMKYQNGSAFVDRKRSNKGNHQQRKSPHAKDSYSLSHEYLKKIQPKLMETGTPVSTKAIQCKSSLKFGPKLCNPARKPGLIQAMKKKHLNFAMRHASWDIDIEIKTFFLSLDIL